MENEYYLTDKQYEGIRIIFNNDVAEHFCMSIKCVQPMKVIYSYLTVFVLHSFLWIFYIYGLFNDAVSSSDYIASNNGMIS
jgi:hypothetical protein